MTERSAIADGGASPRQVPIWEKSNLTLEEAAAYSGIGINKLRSLSDKEHCQFVLWVGSKRLIKRRKLDEYTERIAIACGFFRVRPIQGRTLFFVLPYFTLFRSSFFVAHRL